MWLGIGGILALNMWQQNENEKRNQDMLNSAQTGAGMTDTEIATMEQKIKERWAAQDKSATATK
jgi:hypothetical protein